MAQAVSTAPLKSAPLDPRLADGARSGGAEKTDKTEAGSAAGVVAKAHAELNTSIVQASLSVAIGAGNEPLALLYKSAITGINEALRADFGDDALQAAAGQDQSPEATAGRIVSMSTAFYGAWREQHPDGDEDAARQQFVDLVRGGAERGFGEARDILQGLKVLEGDVASNIDKTYTLMQQGFDKFAAGPQEADAAEAG
ncbi:MAG: DUF5610 domain-containing protein [Massilia sp.]